MTGDSEAIELKRCPCKFRFDIKVQTSKGALYCVHLKRILNETEVSALEMDTAPNEKNKASVNFHHAQLGHINERDTREIARILDQPLNILKFKKCEPCAKAKASTKPLKATKVIHKPKNLRMGSTECSWTYQHCRDRINLHPNRR